ncbi:MAG: hypothetical protein DRN54_01560 [Thaumarchaeota archaeon]|nr:MAG: hypothetical protein DRN54_01560 [Nitrososphaerota archaeon]
MRERLFFRKLIDRAGEEGLPNDHLMEVAERVLKQLKVNRGELRSISAHGSVALGRGDEPYYILIVLRGKAAPRFHKFRELDHADLVITVGAREFEEDCIEERLGGATSCLLLLPYEPLIGEDFLKRMEICYKRHVISESLQNLILEHRLASNRLLIKPEYFLYDKLKKLSTIYLLIRPLMRSCFEKNPEQSLSLVLPGFELALSSLISEGILVKRKGLYSPSEKHVSSVLSKSPIFLKLSGSLEHVFRLYLNASLSSPIDSLKEMSLDLPALKPVKLPDPLEFIEMETALGPQPLKIELGVKEFVERVYGIRREKVRVRRAAGVLNSTYVAEFPLNGSSMRLFVKRYLNWTDFKWAVAWIWSIGVKNFSLLASIRMSNEIYFVNKLMELGFNTAEILHVNWSRKILFQRFIDGENFLRILMGAEDDEKIDRISQEVGELLAKVHRSGICLGDCNPFSFLFAPDGKIYLVDLEQCSYDGSYAWDLAELLYYTARYLNSDQAERFASGLAEGYLKVGDREAILQAMDLKYARVLAPLSLPRTPSELREAIMRVVKK